MGRLIHRIKAKRIEELAYQSQAQNMTTGWRKRSHTVSVSQSWCFALSACFATHQRVLWPLGRYVEIEDVELAVNAQKGFKNGILGLGRLHPQEEHAVKWYLDKVRNILVKHAGMEKREGRNIDYAIPKAQSDAVEADELCRLVGPEIDW